MLPNVPQYPVAVAAILRAGYVVVNVNPLYTLRRAGAPAQATGLQSHHHHRELCPHAGEAGQYTRQTRGACAMGDQLGLIKGALVNHVVRNVKKMVPAYRLPEAVKF